MFFLKCGKLLAHLAFWFSVLRLGIAFYVAFYTPDMAANEAASRRYLSAANSGEAFNEAFYVLLYAIAAGIICEIGLRFVRSEKTES